MNKVSINKTSLNKAHVGVYMAIALVANVVFHSGLVKLISIGL